MKKKTGKQLTVRVSEEFTPRPLNKNRGDELLKGFISSGEFHLMPHDEEEETKILYGILRNPKFQESVIKSEHFISELNKYGFDYDQLPNGSQLKIMVSGFSEFFEITKKKLNTRNPEIGQFNKDNADNFVENITEELNKVEAEGFTSTRKIAERFNEKGIPSFRGGQWSHNTVARLLRRRKELGMDGDNLTQG